MLSRIRAWIKRRHYHMYPEIHRQANEQRATKCKKWNEWVASQKNIDERQESAAEWLENNRHLF